MLVLPRPVTALTSGSLMNVTSPRMVPTRIGSSDRGEWATTSGGVCVDKSPRAFLSCRSRTETGLFLVGGTDMARDIDTSQIIHSSLRPTPIPVQYIILISSSEITISHRKKVKTRQNQGLERLWRMARVVENHDLLVNWVPKGGKDLTLPKSGYWISYFDSFNQLLTHLVFRNAECAGDGYDCGPRIRNPARSFFPRSNAAWTTTGLSFDFSGFYG